MNVPPTDKALELLKVRCDLHLTENVPWQLLYCNAASGRLTGEVFLINSVEGCKIAHLSQETCSLYNMLVICACCMKDLTDVFANSVSLISDSCCIYLTILWIDRDLS